MKKIQINILSHMRESFFEFIFNYLIKIKNENKDLIKIVIHQSWNHDFWKQVVKQLNNNNIETTMVGTGPDYMTKIHNAIKTDCKYSCSMDDDILINNFLWDYLIENVDILEDNKNLFLAPLISNGIPSTDYFIEDFMNDNDKNVMYKIFKNFKIEDNMWGADYSHLKKYTIDSEVWDADKYYEGVSEINHYYKGIHPVRASFDAQIKIAEIVMNNYDKFKKSNNYYLDIINRPYFCNSFFFIKTDVWIKIILDKSLFKDSYDEVPLNLYKDKYNLNMVFVRNGYCIQMAYNTIGGEKQSIIEKYYKEKLKALDE